MALITCPECGHQVADSEKLCPDCGSDITKLVLKDSIRKANIFVTVLVTIVIIALIMLFIYPVSKVSDDMFRPYREVVGIIVWLIEALSGNITK
jgi:uncharacterized membrane protein YvbJ